MFVLPVALCLCAIMRALVVCAHVLVQKCTSKMAFLTLLHNKCSHTDGFCWFKVCGSMQMHMGCGAMGINRTPQAL